MRRLLEFLEYRSRTLTVYDYGGDDRRLADLENWLGAYGVTVQTASTDRGAPAGVAVLHREGDVMDACHVEELLARADFDAAVERGEEPPRPDILASLSTDVAVRPARSVREMVRGSREIERRGLREGAGVLHAGFQRLSRIADSERTMAVYRALAEGGVDVSVYGYPDVELDDAPFGVVEDESRTLTPYWFLLYDGGGNPHRKAALVSEECSEDGEAGPTASDRPGRRSAVYDSYFTTDSGTVDDLFELARETHADLLAGPE